MFTATEIVDLETGTGIIPLEQFVEELETSFLVLRQNRQLDNPRNRTARNIGAEAERGGGRRGI
eukprot:767095-Hanusia_phi.AAC.5